MTQIHQSRPSASPYIETVWRTQNTADGTYLSTPDGSWDLILCFDKRGRRSMLLTGQATEPAYIPYTAGTSSVVISFSPSAYLASLAGDPLLNSAKPLPDIDGHHFSLDGSNFAYPTFETAERLVQQMVDAGVLRHDEIVDSAVKGKPKATSSRAVQRHFAQSAGVTHKQLQQIYRAQAAVRLLKQGKRPADAAAEAGYTDQPHLAKSLKRIMYSKPSDIDDIHKI